MFWNQVKKGTKIKSREIESRSNEEWGSLGNQVESEKKKKKERMEIYGYTCVVEKNQEKKKGKKKETYGW